MKRIALIIAAVSLPLAALAGQAKDQATAKDNIPITITAKGTEVRTVLADIFEQEKKQYVMAPDIHFQVFLSIEKVDFHKALEIVCTLSGLQATLTDGIYFVHKGRTAEVKPVVATTKQAAPVVTPLTTPAPQKIVLVPATVVTPKPSGPLPAATLLRHVTTRLSKEDIRGLFAELGKQANVKIVVDDAVPDYRLDAFLINTSLRFALNKITKAAGLTWSLSQSRTIVIKGGDAATKVAIVKG